MEPVRKDTWSAFQYNKTASFVYSDAYTQPVLDSLSPLIGESILDMGCGTGELTYRLQEFVGRNGLVVGVDSSQDMLAKAKKNNVTNLFCCDIQSLTMPEDFKSLEGTFNAVFTNAALHWCKRDPSGVVQAAKRALQPGGRFVGEFGGYLNCVGVRSILHQVLRGRGIEPSKVDPWYFPRPENYAKVLESEGFKVEYISLNPRITPLPGPLIDWLRTFARNSLLAEMNDEEAEHIMREVSDLCEPDMKDKNGGWAIMYVRLRFRAVIPI
ncbi:S-adenosyl-L-methionine-dependent methyltransferase [Rhizoctonia solani]|nr:S-adenosyl-L-methionine-dependent methyltransferase [Rhizoctonia solani]